jgi:molecular chaperone GrpE
MTTSKREIPINGKLTTAEPMTADPVEIADDKVDTKAPADHRDAAAKERDQLAEALLRLRAEFDNYRKRSTRELTDARSCAQGDLLADLLPVLDNLERALDAAEHHEEGKVLQGVRMTRDLFVGLLTRAGVEEVPGVGTPFDPLVHDAILTQPSDEDEGLVTAVLERGYRQGEQVLRPARVAVSAGRCDLPASG